jgi:uncharacterized coiled-coil protein SlyX
VIASAAQERLEVKVAFLEQANQELSDTVYRQQREIDALKNGLAEVAGRLDALRDQAGSASSDEERPPHY